MRSSNRRYRRGRDDRGARPPTRGVVAGAAAAFDAALGVLGAWTSPTEEAAVRHGERSRDAAWLADLGVPPPPVRSLPVNEVAPGVVVEGPVPELTDAVRELHRRFHRAGGLSRPDGRP
ncbi:hypothetical protein [Streptomyces sp. NPDC047706]|uniref:hypothetical protein n=1 Tax=Streptomyces sp. NPDC047706 TaxID=3365486 RepID=UPI003710BA59